MSAETNSQDALLEAVLAALEEDGPSADEELRSEGVRGHLQALALLPYALEPETPPQALRQQVMDRVRGASQTSDSAEAATVADLSQARRSSENRRLPAPPAGGALVWPWRLAAAVLALCVLGLGLFAFSLNQRLSQQEVALATLGDTLGPNSAAGPEATATEVARLQQQLDDLSQRFTMITTTAARLYPIRPQQASLQQSRVRGVMYVCSDHQRWYVNLQGLEPAPDGREYHLWFLTADGPVDARTFQVTAGQPAEMRDLTMPNGTRGVAVSLEPADEPHGPRPTGPILLKGDESMRI
ncbi:MAG: anti-sigma factor [Acidobacteriota bacterium]|nr:anti-sigma factor [Acidobacteriota bacterium]